MPCRDSLISKTAIWTFSALLTLLLLSALPAAAAPRIDGYSPSSVPPGGHVAMRGAEFGLSQGTKNVVLGQGDTVRGTTTVTAWTESQIEVDLPTSVAAGRYWLAIHDRRGQEKARGPETLTIAGSAGGGGDAGAGGHPAMRPEVVAGAAGRIRPFRRVTGRLTQITIRDDCDPRGPGEWQLTIYGIAYDASDTQVSSARSVWPRSGRRSVNSNETLQINEVLVLREVPADGHVEFRVLATDEDFGRARWDDAGRAVARVRADHAGPPEIRVGSGRASERRRHRCSDNAFEAIFHIESVVER